MAAYIIPQEAALVGYALGFVLFAGSQILILAGYAKIPP